MTDTLRRHLSRITKERMDAMPPEERSAAASKAAKARWRKSRKPSRVRPVEVRAEGKWDRFESITAASGTLGVSRTTIYAWIEKGEARYAD